MGLGLAGIGVDRGLAFLQRLLIVAAFNIGYCQRQFGLRTASQNMNSRYPLVLIHDKLLL